MMFKAIKATMVFSKDDHYWTLLSRYRYLFRHSVGDHDGKLDGNF